MHRVLLLLFLLITACAGRNFDEASIPTEQISTEMAFTRLAKHGEMEPVLEIGQELENWQFLVAGTSISSFSNGEKTTILTLKDRSGIDYTVSTATTPSSIIEKMKTGSYGYGTGEVASVERNLPAGKIAAVVALREWRLRE